MEEKYKLALKAGIIGGLVTAIPTILFELAFITSFNLGDTMMILPIIIFIVYLVAAFGAGLLATYYAKPLLHTMMDVIKVSGTAGALNGIIFGVILSIASLIFPIFVHNTPDSHITFSVASSTIGIPIYIVFCAAMTAVLAIIGGMAYAISKASIKL